MTTTSSATGEQSTSGRNPLPPGETSDGSASLETLDLSSGWEITNKARRESKQLKAMRLLVTGRLRVLRVDRDFIAAECRGDSGEVYNLLWKHQHWTCSCAARTDCSHLNALWAVVAVNRP